MSRGMFRPALSPPFSSSLCALCVKSLALARGKALTQRARRKEENTGEFRGAFFWLRLARGADVYFADKTSGGLRYERGHCMRNIFRLQRSLRILFRLPRTLR